MATSIKQISERDTMGHKKLRKTVMKRSSISCVITSDFPIKHKTSYFAHQMHHRENRGVGLKEKLEMGASESSSK